MNTEKLQEYRSASGLTYEQISDITGASVRTVSAIFTNPNYNPTIDTIVPVVAVIGGDMNEVCGIAVPPPNTLPPPGTADHELIRQVYRSNNQTIAALAATVAHLKRQNMILHLENALLVIFILFVVVYDITHPTIGFVQYTASAVTQTWAAIKDQIHTTLQAVLDAKSI